MEHGRISVQQMSMLLYSSIAFDTVLTIPSTTGLLAMRDLWISPLLASVVGLAVLFCVLRLQRVYPQETLIQYCDRLAGTVLGKCISFVLLFFFLHTNALILREYTDFISAVFLDQTPALVISGGMVLLVSLAVRCGLEVLGRLAGLLLPGSLVLFALLVLCSSPSWKLDNMLPVMEYGIVPALKGALTPASWFVFFWLMSMMHPYVKEQTKITKWSLLVWGGLLTSMVVSCLSALFIFGENVAVITYPFMEVVRYIRFGDFFQHVDAVLIVVWVAGTFLQLCVTHYAVVLGTAQWFKLSRYPPLALPLGMIWTVLSVWDIPNLQKLREILSVDSTLSCDLAIVILILLVVASWLRRKKSA
ncbi:GerAB/ArcD/ProY family transporter [Tumebacillus flagellatus]|uniref:Uncharacterized protein n=1 Tax=Tumebacillus flagellatus TaxID=1157490 RepID=A0A074LRQ7_9BACL|nr:endospore germination permease [Tumebacillus flagellatus]KEO84831.1 hypothetical protein EL26_02130 [Tumebacillus flagellatus]